MQIDQVIRCPNCGSIAERHIFTSSQLAHLKCPSHQVTQTECQNCDYLIVMCSLNGGVVEAYAPSRTIPTKFLEMS